MSLSEAIFSGADPQLIERLRRTLESAFGVREEGRAQIRRNYLDTFDWRVLCSGGLLIEDGSRRPSQLSWLASDGELLHGPFDAMDLSFAQDLPPGPFRNELRKVTQVRRIEKRVLLRAQSTRLALTDARGKAVVRLGLLQGSASSPAPGATTARIDGQLRVRSVRGYDSQFDQALRLISESGADLVREDDELSSLLRLLEIDPQQTRSRFRIQLDPAMPAAVGVRRILLQLAQTMQLNTEGTRRDLDTEYLHDFRVALRRTRSCLGLLQGVLEPQRVAPFVDAFPQLGRITGVVRDLDVHRMELPAYRRALSVDETSSLEPIDVWLTENQRREQRRMARVLGSKSHRELMQRWIALLEDESSGSSDAAPDAARPLGELARERIRRAHDRIVRRGSKLKLRTRAEKVHQLRIDCKKLRYLLEFFRSLFDAQQLDGAIGELKKLQDVLGEFNDLDMQSTSLAIIAEELLRAGKGDAGTLIAAGRLIERAQRKQQKLRVRLIPRIREFISTDVSAQFEEMTR